MKKVFYWIPTAIFLIVFLLILLIFHPLQVLALRLGYTAHNKVVELMIALLIHSLWIVGKPLSIKGSTSHLPKGKPLIVICNHASMFDIPILYWVFKKFHPKFISKKELAYGIPSVSFNIRHGGSVHIDRHNPKQAYSEIKKLSEYAEATQRSVVIFPEGTRSKTGALRPFKEGGILALLKNMPNGVVVPVAIKNSYTIEKYKMKPIPFGKPMTCTILPIIDRSHHKANEITELAKQQIEKALNL